MRFQNLKMSLRVLAIIISIQFLAFTVVPSILAVVDDSYDISLLINSSEEEEKKLKDFENPSKETIECDFYLNNLGDRKSVV